MSDSKLTHYLGSVIDNVFTGAASDAVVAILLLVIVGMGVAIWFLCRALYIREKQYQAQLAKQSDALEASQQQLQELTSQYVESLKDINTEYNESAKDTARALTELRIALVEVKIIVSSRMMKH